MNTAWQKMVSGEEYQADDPEIIRVLNLTKDAIRAYNQIQPTRLEEREKAIRKIIGKCGVKPFFNQPFLCDYGVNIRVGDRFFANFNFTVLDEAYVTIGDDVFIGPNVSLYTACHSTDPVERNTRREWAEPITIGNNVWIGGSVTVLPGVTIGDNCTIGAGSVVTKDIPANSIAVGNPCRVIKKVGQESLKE
ncbi:sugar O-acetyltransferase [Prevotella sp. A2931]|uniref:Acetyltransferase n=1 Tax=Prevotella illustrans TaxID=2800387 RepID=A0ABS3M441_9BACT|nr:MULTISPECIES: sugar O-acetyltransferase [Prevotella]MBO1362944.1 sugar O-acetyltransferase [Prevotella illustrans]PTL27151.1 galactoside O-acetyltransferase [Prevotella sp. oral taxon 820]